MSCDTADTQITTTSNGGCKNRSRIDMEICLKQQDIALNLLVKTLRFFPRHAQPGSFSWWLSISPGTAPGSGTSRIQEQPHFAPLVLQNLGPSKSKQCPTQHSLSMENTASPALQPGKSLPGAHSLQDRGGHSLVQCWNLQKASGHGESSNVKAGLCHGVAGHGPAVLCGAGGCPRHWGSHSLLLFLLLSCAITRDTHEQPRWPKHPSMVPSAFSINLPFREKSQPSIFWGR